MRASASASAMFVCAFRVRGFQRREHTMVYASVRAGAEGPSRSLGIIKAIIVIVCACRICHAFFDHSYIMHIAKGIV